MSDQPSAVGGSGADERMKKPFVATVIDNNDPKGWGRIRARVQEMFEGISDEHLPWCRPTFQHPGGGSAEHGVFFVPENGTKVLVEFQEGNVLNPRYLGYMIDETTILPEAKVNYPKRRVTLYPSGTMILIDDQTEQVMIRASGQLNLFVDGDAFVKINGNMVQQITGNRTTFVDGNDVLVVGGDAHKFAANIVESASGNLNSEAGGTHQTYAGGNAMRDAGGQIHDDGGGGSSGASAPGAPTFPQWEGVRGATP